MDQEEINQSRARFNVQGGASTFEDKNVKGAGGGGRIGVSKELESVIESLLVSVARLQV